MSEVGVGQRIWLEDLELEVRLNDSGQNFHFLSLTTNWEPVLSLSLSAVCSRHNCPNLSLIAWFRALPGDRCFQMSKSLLIITTFILLSFARGASSEIHTLSSIEASCSGALDCSSCTGGSFGPHPPPLLRTLQHIYFILFWIVVEAHFSILGGFEIDSVSPSWSNFISGVGKCSWCGITNTCHALASPLNKCRYFESITNHTYCTCKAQCTPQGNTPASACTWYKTGNLKSPPANPKDWQGGDFLLPNYGTAASCACSGGGNPLWLSKPATCIRSFLLSAHQGSGHSTFLLFWFVRFERHHEAFDARGLPQRKICMDSTILGLCIRHPWRGTHHLVWGSYQSFAGVWAMLLCRQTCSSHCLGRNIFWRKVCGFRL